jgi:hypothetical protein
MMPSWITPITDWDATDYYNFHVDLDRVENNTDYLDDYFSSLGYTSGISSIVTGRDNTSLVYYDDMNRIEGNIRKLKDCSFLPLTWETPNEAWESAKTTFDYNVTNRLEKNLLGLKDMIDSIAASLLYCGDSMTTICGKGNTLF